MDSSASLTYRQLFWDIFSAVRGYAPLATCLVSYSKPTALHLVIGAIGLTVQPDYYSAIVVTYSCMVLCETSYDFS